MKFDLNEINYHRDMFICQELLRTIRKYHYDDGSSISYTNYFRSDGSLNYTPSTEPYTVDYVYNQEERVRMFESGGQIIPLKTLNSTEWDLLSEEGHFQGSLLFEPRDLLVLTIYQYLNKNIDRNVYFELGSFFKGVKRKYENL